MRRSIFSIRDVISAAGFCRSGSECFVGCEPLSLKTTSRNVGVPLIADLSHHPSGSTTRSRTDQSHSEVPSVRTTTKVHETAGLTSVKASPKTTNCVGDQSLRMKLERREWKITLFSLLSSLFSLFSSLFSLLSSLFLSSLFSLLSSLFSLLSPTFPLLSLLLSLLLSETNLRTPEG